MGKRKIDTHFMLPFQDALDFVKDSDAGKIFKALNRYRVGCQRERLEKESLQNLYEIYCDAIDEDRKQYFDVCAKNTENIKKRWELSKQTSSFDNITIQEESSKDIAPIRIQSGSSKSNDEMQLTINKIKSYSEQAKNDTLWLDRICMNAHVAYNIDANKVLQTLDVFSNVVSVEVKPPETYSDFKVRFRQYLDSHGKNISYQSNNGNTENIRNNKSGFINACESIDKLSSNQGAWGDEF